MALNANTLAALMASKINAVEDSYKNGEKDPEDALKAMCEAIIEHIQSDARVIISGGSSSGTYQVS